MNNSSTTLYPGSAAATSPGPVQILAALFVGLLIILTLLGNLLVIASFSLFHELRTICNYFIVSLSAADILVALVAMPFWCALQVTKNEWIFSRELHLFWACMDILCGTASIMNLTAVSIDRQFAITMPFYYENVMSPKKALITIFFVWIYAGAFSGLRLVMGSGTEYMNLVAFGSFFCPLAIMMFMYLRIYLVARYQVRRIGRNYMTDVKAAKTIAVVIGVFVVCWSPLFVIVMGFAHQPGFGVDMITLNVIKWMEYLNSCLNPVIYTCLNRNYRRAFRKLLRRCIRLRNRPGLSPSSTINRTVRMGSLSVSVTFIKSESNSISSRLRGGVKFKECACIRPAIESPSL